MQGDKIFAIETTKDLTDVVASLSNGQAMARSHDVLVRIKGALTLDAKRLSEIAIEMDKYAEAYHRYLALRREQEAHEKSAHGLMALIGPHNFVELMKADRSDAIGEQIEVTPNPVALRESASLWEFVYQYLRFVPEARIGEIVDFLQLMGIVTSKQAIESAIRTHAKTFRTRKRGREKYISLKGEQ